MAIIGNVMAYKAYLSQAKSMQALDKQDYAAAIECENKALEGYEKAMAKGMNQVNYLIAYTVLLLRTGKFEKAMEIIRQTEKMPNLNEDQKRRLIINYSICQWKLGDIDHAIGAMIELSKTYKNSTVYGSLGYMLIARGDKTGDYSEARKFNDEAMDYDDEDAVVLDNVGQYYQRTGDYEKAREYFGKALEIRPTQVDSMYYLAKVNQAEAEQLMQQGDSDSITQAETYMADAKKLVDKAMGIHFSALATVTHSDFRPARLHSSEGQVLTQTRRGCGRGLLKLRHAAPYLCHLIFI